MQPLNIAIGLRFAGDTLQTHVGVVLFGDFMFVRKYRDAKNLVAEFRLGPDVETIFVTVCRELVVTHVLAIDLDVKEPRLPRVGVGVRGLHHARGQRQQYGPPTHLPAGSSWPLRCAVSNAAPQVDWIGKKRGHGLLVCLVFGAPAGDIVFGADDAGKSEQQKRQ